MSYMTEILAGYSGPHRNSCPIFSLAVLEIATTLIRYYCHPVENWRNLKVSVGQGAREELKNRAKKFLAIHVAFAPHGGRGREAR